MKLSDLKDKYKDQIGFVVGAGPSLHFQNVDLIKNNIVIAVNSGIKKVPFCQYCLSDDHDIYNWDYFNYLKELSCAKLFYKKKCSHFEKEFKEGEIVFFDHLEYVVAGQPNGKNLKLTKREPIIGARTSVASAIHVAYIFGCNPIILLGVDCNHYQGKRYYWQFDGEEPCKRLDDKNVYKILNHSSDFIKYWKLFKIMNKNLDINILNASIINNFDMSSLDVFPKISLEQVLEKYYVKR